ncbi:MAG: allophanate hydrolase [Opitutaceae bacterium]|nr:allophanate hydrolase [Opitutaceae bacterium]
MASALSLDLATLRVAYATGTLTPSALVEEILRRIDAHGDPAIFIHILSRDALLAHAARLEKLPPDSLPLYGAPFAIKDNIDLAGAPTTAACPEFSYTPSVSAPVVQRLLEAGAIPLGKANLDQFATGLVGVRSPYGVPRNPFCADVIPGGSSSGSAVAVAAGLCSFSLGTDTAGSGRIPAGLNNLVGLKPTKGALSTRGVVPACRSLDCVSIFALTCADAAELQRVAEAFDPADAFSRQRPALAPLPSTLRIGVPAARDLEFFGDIEAGQLFSASVSRLTALGATVVEIDFAPFRETAALLYQGPWVAERWAALRAFHAQHADAFFPVTRTIVEGANALSAADTFEGFYKVAALARRAAAEWEKMDALLLPTAPRPYTFADLAAEPLLHNTHLGTYTNFVNLLDLSAIAVPAGFRRDGVPWGVTFVAPAWRDPDLLTLAARWHTQVGGTLGATSTPLPLSLVPPLSVSPSPANIRLAVVGAHLSGLPLNHQLTDRHARLVWSGTTAPAYRLYALPNTTPPKPGLVRVADTGAAIAVEVWELSIAAFGSFVAAVPPPLCIGSLALANGDTVKGFLCEPAALDGATDITAHGGWRTYLESLGTVRS